MFPDIPDEVQRAADRAVLLYLCDPNVSLIDIGWRIHDRENYAVEPELCVRVHLRRKLRGEGFRAFAERCPQRVVKPDLIGFTVDIPGDVIYRPHLITGFPSAFSFRPLTATNPLCGGISISNAATFSAGTLGGWVQDRHTQADMVLSNWHVLCCPWADWDDLPIYQPGRLDGGYAENTVAHLARHAMEQNIDAAVGALSGVRDLINKQRGIGIVTGVAIPRLGMQVIKSGRTTGVTSGIIDGVGGRRIFNYGGFSHMIREHIHIIPIPDGDQTVSSAGDSGAWWLDESTHCAVGLHFGGSDNPEYALAFSMPTVLDSLQVDIVV